MASKKPCKYGGKCYRKNPQHLRDYSHPNDLQTDDQEEENTKGKRKNVDIESEETDTKKMKGASSTQEEMENKEEDSGNSSDAAEDGTDDGDVGKDLPSPDDLRENIKQKYLMEMPEDFYQFWEFCKKLKKSNPENAMYSSLGWTLVGPFDILAGKHKSVTKNKKGRRPNFLLHYRYYYDPPEFMTVIKGDSEKQFHIGYFRDDPSEMPAFVGVNEAAVSCNIVPKGENLFGAAKNIIDEELKSKSTAPERKTKLEDFQNQLIEFAKSKNISLALQTPSMKQRNKKVVCKTFHGAGIVVPVDENEVGYRPVPETPADLKKMLKKIVESKTEEERDKNMDPIQEIVTLVQFANDECDYGEGLELGIDLFCYGGEVLHPMVEHLLPLAYQLLGRFEFKDIIESHLNHRSRKVNNELEV
ncbi:histone PARylation factor 1-like [Crassostrea virginica]